MDWLEDEWKNKLMSIGTPSDEAEVLARLMAQMERDAGLIGKIKQDGFKGFCRWIEINCKDIYYKVKSILQSIWNWITSSIF